MTLHFFDGAMEGGELLWQDRDAPGIAVARTRWGRSTSRTARSSSVKSRFMRLKPTATVESFVKTMAVPIVIGHSLQTMAFVTKSHPAQGPS
ncbi:MAG: hypothetical protein KF682_21220, partial [Nitrospira sp.]|nr:hypothetical protein [Nitrospira sp.]